MMKTDTLILGGGLSGLYAAHLLTRNDEDFLLLEARDRLGGRILSEADPATPDSTVGYDLGPSWFWPDFQPQVQQLVEELGILTFPQYTTGLTIFEDEHGRRSRRSGQTFPSQASEPRSFRIEGGVTRLVDRLAEGIEAQRIRRSFVVKRLEAVEGGVVVAAEDRTVAAEDRTGTAEDRAGITHTFVARRVLLAAPPRLLVRTIEFEPPIPAAARQTLLDVPTWMAGHAKFVALYEKPTWRQQGLSGQAFSHRGPLVEIHDACPIEGGPFALFGFYGIPAMARRRVGNALIEESIAQLERLFGPGMLEPLHTLFKDWSEDPLTATSEDLTPPAGHPSYGLPDAVQVLWDGRLHFCSTEVSVRNGGYLEGALDAACRAAGGPTVQE